MLVHKFVTTDNDLCFCPRMLGGGRSLGLGGRGREGGGGGSMLGEERVKEGSVGARVAGQEGVALLFSFEDYTV